MSWGPGHHASTFGGNPVAARRRWRRSTLLEEGLIDNAAARGEQAKDGLRL